MPTIDKVFALRRAADLAQKADTQTFNVQLQHRLKPEQTEAWAALAQAWATLATALGEDGVISLED